MENSIPVLIVGAGPSGLMMACELARRQIPFRIIDKKPERTLTSNAAWIQTRTLEIFDHLGIVDQFLALGHRGEGLNMIAQGKLVMHLSLSRIDSIYRFGLVLSQSETERLLEVHLNKFHHLIERSVELTTLEQNKNQVTATLQTKDGKLETITTQWLIACDGANSTIRQLCGIHFPGQDIPEQFMIADAEISTYETTHTLHVYLNKDTLFPDKRAIVGFIPFGSHHYRVVANLYQSHPRKNFTDQEVKEIVRERSLGQYAADKITWVSPFWIHSKMVNQFRFGSIFLVGDTAHIHSPIGAQGMNTGLQDAYNLAWKLALAIQGKAKPDLLDSYHAERYPVDKSIVDGTEFFTRMALFDKYFIIKIRCVYFVITYLWKNLAKMIAMRFTQLSIRYLKSPIIHYKERTPFSAPRQGERAPNVKIQPHQSLYDYFKDSEHHLLLFTGPSISPALLESLIELQQTIHQRYQGLVKVHIVSPVSTITLDNVISDENKVIHQKYHQNSPAVYLIRPDTTIAYYSKKLNSSLIIKFLNQYLL